MNANVLRLDPAVVVLAARIVLIGGWTGAALAGEFDPAKVPSFTWMLVAGSALVGYLSSSAEVLFGWVENRGWRSFGKIVQGFFASMAAGFAAYFVAAYAGVPLVMALLGTLGAAIGGETSLRKLTDRTPPGASLPVGSAEEKP